MLLNNEEKLKVIIEHLSMENINLEINLTKYLVYIGKNNNVLNIQPLELNNKFIELSKPSNTYCKENYIDYNFIVDQIVDMSAPYLETQRDRKKINLYNKSNTVYFVILLETPFKVEKETFT